MSYDSWLDLGNDDDYCERISSTGTYFLSDPNDDSCLWCNQPLGHLRPHYPYCSAECSFGALAESEETHARCVGGVGGGDCMKDKSAFIPVKPRVVVQSRQCTNCKRDFRLDYPHWTLCTSCAWDLGRPARAITTWGLRRQEQLEALADSGVDTWEDYRCEK